MIEAPSVAVAFLVDCTASMGPWIHAVKTKVREIVDRVRHEHPEGDIQVGLVAYRDYGDLPRFRVLDFTTPEALQDALEPLRAEGGDDEAEDVAGALHRVLRLSWDNVDVRMVVHLADAPAHGMKFHAASLSDRFPDGDPTGLEPLDDIHAMAVQGFHYTFVKSTSATDMMLDEFYSVWNGPGFFRVLDLGQQTREFPLLVSRVVSQAIDQHTFWQDR